MHIYFSGIGGAGIGPLALIAHQAGYEVSGSDMQNSLYLDSLSNQGIRLHVGQTLEKIQTIHQNNPIDWIVFSSAVSITNPHHPELVFAKRNKIKISKRDECLNTIIKNKKLKLIAIAGTHGKTSTTAFSIWLLKKLGLDVSYSVGAKLSFGPMGQFNNTTKYFVYECDEFDRNFLSFNPYISIITSVDWDHHEIYKTRDDYKNAFIKYIKQSRQTYMLKKDAKYLGINSTSNINVINENSDLLNQIKLIGIHNRQNAFIAINAISEITDKPINKLIEIAGGFPNVSRRFEQIAKNIYTDYAHTPEEIEATLQMANEISDRIVVIYEPLTDRRQHYMKEQYKHVFEKAKKVYWLPSYLAREDPNSPVLNPEELIANLSGPTNAIAYKRDTKLLETIKKHAGSGDLVICLAGGGGNSLDEWIRQNLIIKDRKEL